MEEFLSRPPATVGLSLDIYGVRYPPEALAALTGYGAVYRGWIANARVPEVFARHLATVHVPRRYYAFVLPGIPTIRIFEALACIRARHACAHRAQELVTIATHLARAQ